MTEEMRVESSAAGPNIYIFRNARIVYAHLLEPSDKYSPFGKPEQKKYGLRLLVPKNTSGKQTLDELFMGIAGNPAGMRFETYVQDGDDRKYNDKPLDPNEKYFGYWVYKLKNDHRPDLKDPGGAKVTQDYKNIFHTHPMYVDLWVNITIYQGKYSSKGCLTVRMTPTAVQKIKDAEDGAGHMHVEIPDDEFNCYVGSPTIQTDIGNLSHRQETAKYKDDLIF